MQDIHFQAANLPTCTNKNFSNIFTANAPVKKKGILVAINNFSLSNSKIVSKIQKGAILFFYALSTTLFTPLLQYML